MKNKLFQILLFLKLLNIILCKNLKININNNNYDKLINIDDNISLIWNIKSDKIYFELILQGHGYLGLGFADEKDFIKFENIDLCFGYIDDSGEGVIQDFHLNKSGELEIDQQQDCELQKASQNRTHTILKFYRRFQTCDLTEDFLIKETTPTNLMFLYTDTKTKEKSLKEKNLPKFLDLQRAHRNFNFELHETVETNELINFDLNKMKTLVLRNQDVELPLGDDSIYWCKIFKLNSELEENFKSSDVDEEDDEDLLKNKHHLIRFEPIYDSNMTSQYLRHINLYECQGSIEDLELLSRERHGRICLDPSLQSVLCNQMIVTWVSGTEGFTLPNDVGIPIDPAQTKFFMMETHYTNQNYIESSDIDSIIDNESKKSMVDNSGLKLFLTSKLRKHDAGLLSIGIESSWKHIIPPGQKEVYSEGHCISECTKPTFPTHGINLLAVMMRTNLIGKEMKFKLVRKNIEHELAVVDRLRSDLDRQQEFRTFDRSIISFPGDQLSINCVYDSSSRSSITLGGPTLKGEICQAVTLYYPKLKTLTSCNSLTSLPTVLHSLGIEELALESNPVVIASPTELAGQTLESRLISYNWTNSFNKFQDITNKGSFKPFCWNANSDLIPGTEKLEGFRPNITKTTKHYSNHHNSRNKHHNQCYTTNSYGKINNNNRLLKSGAETKSSIRSTSSQSHENRENGNSYNNNFNNSNSNNKINNNNNNSSSSSSSSSYKNNDSDSSNITKTKVLRSSVPETMSYSKTNHLNSNVPLAIFFLIIVLFSSF